ncbi:MAG: hypothetical protein ACTHKM_01265 [Tsuneonella sp.]
MTFTWLDILCGIGAAAAILLGGFLARRIDHGELRFDSKTGKTIDDE